MTDYYTHIYMQLYHFTLYEVKGVPLCRLIAPVVLMVMLWISRIISSLPMKFFSVIIAIIFYYLPDVIGVFMVK